MQENFEVKKIMIVEDNPVNQKVMQKLVKIFGHESIVVEDGFQALEQVKLHNPALILMDIQLIGISGIDITKDIKADENLRNIPVIAVTASVILEDKERIINESRCDDYLSKPFLPKELYDKISKFLTLKKIDFN